MYKLSEKININHEVRNKKILLLFFIASVFVYFISVSQYSRLAMADDGAFFLRYAENMLHGEFWVWNLGEAPVWGASAPLYPLLIAVPMLFGATPVDSLFGVGIVLGILSFAGIGSYLVYRFGLIVGVIFLVFTATDVGLMYFTSSGLESPLAFLLLGLAVWGLLSNKPWWFMGFVAGLLMVHKLDMVPAGGLLLLALWFQEKRFPAKAIILATVIAVGWYVFAWNYFGAPVPNSFLTKSLYQNDFYYSIDWKWFGSLVLTSGMHSILVLLAVAAGFSRQFRALFLFLGGLILIHFVAYTIKYPFEPYNWYGMPSVFSLSVLGSLGFYVLLEKIPSKINNAIYYRTVIVVLIGLFALFAHNASLKGVNGINQFIENQEYDRTQAGIWVDQNTPKTFSVYTSWGNPAYFSYRYVYDGSFLNRKYESNDLIKTYKPEILILQNNPGSIPMDPVFAATKGENYRVVKVFDKTYAAGMDYFFAVLAREDIISQLTDVSLPQNLMLYVSSTELGSHYGILKPNDKESLFIHPGMTPTSFEFDVQSYREKTNKNEVIFTIKMADNISGEAVQRGGGNVKVTFVSETGELLFEGVAQVGSPCTYTLKNKEMNKVKIVIDNNGSPDTDWANFYVK